MKSTPAKLTVPPFVNRKPAGMTQSGAMNPDAANPGVAIRTDRLAVLPLGRLPGKTNVRVAAP
jgi:hypothetical protein